MSSLGIPKSKAKSDELASKVAVLNGRAEHFRANPNLDEAKDIHAEAVRIFTDPFSIAKTFIPWITRIKEGNTYKPLFQVEDPFGLKKAKEHMFLKGRPPAELIARSTDFAIGLFDLGNTGTICDPERTRSADRIFSLTLKLESSTIPGSLANAIRNLTYPWTLRDDPAISVDPPAYYTPHIAATNLFKALGEDAVALEELEFV